MGFSVETVVIKSVAGPPLVTVCVMVVDDASMQLHPPDMFEAPAVR